MCRAVELGVQVCPCCVQTPFHPWSVLDSVGSLLSVASVSRHLQPNQTAEIKLSPALNAHFNKSHFCVCSSPLTLHKPPPAYLPTIICPPIFCLSLLLSLHSLFICPFTLRCFAAHHGRLSRLPLVVIPWPCDDCVLYQSVPCVLAQPLPAPCTLHADPCAVAALTVRRAA